MYMRKFVYYLLLVILFNIQNVAAAANIVYPKSDNVTIKSDKTFFAGNTKPNSTLKINSEPIEIHSSGGFFKPVSLEYGENKFVIQDGKVSKTYTITRPKPTGVSSKKAVQKSDFKKEFLYIVNKNNTPLRATPIDSGMNRLQHLEKGILMNVVGEQGDFYKVKLARDDFAWINKDFLSKADNNDFEPAKILSFTYDNIPPDNIFHIKLDKKVPYILSERITYDWKNQQSKPVPKYSGLDLVVYNVEGYPENKYEQFLNVSGNIRGYKSYYNSDNELIIKVTKFPTINKKLPLKGITITLDAGHGGNELGAIGCLGDREKDINLAVTLKLKDLLEKNGAKVYMTRNDDSDVALGDRVKISQKNKSDIFISLHNNSIPDSAANKEHFGSELYYYSPLSKKLATDIVNSLSKELNMYNGGVYQRSFAVLRNTESLCVLIELGYMINPDNNDKLRNPEFQNKAAEAIVHGLEDYLNDLQQ